MENKVLSTNIMDSIVDTNNMSEEQLKSLQELAASRQSTVTGSLSPAQLATLGGYLRKPKQLVRKYAKIGRNDLCPCGSGKKYKNCCLASGKYEELKEA